MSEIIAATVVLTEYLCNYYVSSVLPVLHEHQDVSSILCQQLFNHYSYN